MAVSGTTSGPELLVELDRAGPNRCTASSPTGCATPSAPAGSRRTPGCRRPACSRPTSASRAGSSSTRTASWSRRASCSAGTAPAPGSRPSTRRARRNTPEPARRFDIDFLPGSPDLGSFPRNAWLRALRQGLAEIDSDAFGYVEPQGLPAARAAVADYLRRTRGVQADAQHIVLCSGATQAIATARAQCCGTRELPLAMEDPGFWLHRMVLRHNGIEPLAVPIDDDGLDVAALADSGAATVLSTPAHQSPTGVVLSAARRTALVEWARAGHLIIEDDYDAEYRYDRAPVGALQGIAPDRVIYVGSTSKTLAPGLRIGWMVLPPPLVGAVTMAKGLADTGSSVMDQLAFAQLLTAGGYDRHLRQMRRRYLTRRNALLRALSRYLPQATVLGAAAGVHLTVRFPDGYPIAEVVRRAAEMRVRVEPLAPCYADPAMAPPGLMLGYANLTESQIVTGVQALATAMR